MVGPIGALLDGDWKQTKTTKCKSVDLPNDYYFN